MALKTQKALTYEVKALSLNNELIIAQRKMPGRFGASQTLAKRFFTI